MIRKQPILDSVVKALDAFDKPVILLAGGHDKMTHLEDFMNVVKKNTKEVIFMGEAAERFESVATKVGVTNIHRAQSMKEAVELGYKLAEPSDIVCFHQHAQVLTGTVALKNGATILKNVLKN